MKTVGILIEETEAFLRSDVFLSPVALVMECALAERDIATRLVSPSNPLDDLGNLSGVIFLQAKSADLIREIAKRTPAVALLPDFPDSYSPSVSVDDFAGGKLAAEKLMAGGGKRFVVASGEEENGTIPVPYRKRIAGFTETVAAAGGTVEVLTAPFHHVAGSSGATASRPVGDKIGLILLSKPDRPDGVFAVNDYIASEIVQWFRSSNVSVPDSVQVIGFDNLPTRDMKITTVHVPKTVIARAAADMMDALLSGGTPSSVILKPGLIARDTTRTGEQR